jgi:tetratricopeptide (TPR) repeat protein
MTAAPASEFDEALDAFNKGDLGSARLAAGRGLALGDDARLQHLMGLIECRSGDLASGVEWLRKASDGEPENVGFRVMLARALIDSGRADEALDVADPPNGETAPELALWHARAEAADVTEAHEASAEAWGRLTSARPGDWRAWGNYGDALARLERWAEAVDALRRAVALNPGHRQLRDNLVSALTQAGFHEEAADELSRLLDEGPDNVATRLTLARILADLAREDDAMHQLDKAALLSLGEPAFARGNSNVIAIAIGPDERGAGDLSEDEVEGVRNLALLLERSNRLEALRGLLRDANELGIAESELAYPAAAIAQRDGKAAEAKRFLELEPEDARRVLWHRLMAKIEDSLGNARSAMVEAEAMNRSEPEFDHWVERGASYRKRLHALAEATTAQWAALLPSIAPTRRRSPVFLVGFPRSGTTLLDTFLMGHPNVEVLEEKHMMIEAEQLLGHTVDLPNRSPTDLRRARDAYFAELDRHVDPDFQGTVVDKLPLNMVAIAKVHCLFPEARIIFAQRHPCDVVLSGFMQSFTLNDAMGCFLKIDTAADLYDAAMTVFTNSREALPLNVHDLVYEQLIDDPQSTLRPLIEFLGLDWRSELLDHQRTAAGRGVIDTPSYDQVSRPLTRAPSGRWKRYEQDLEPVLPILLPWAERLGYRD